MHPRKMVRDSIGFAASQFMVRALMIVRTVIAARWLGPQALGTWNALQLVMDYGVLAPFGTQQGLDQMVPRRIVDEDPHRLDRVKRAGITNILVLTLLFCLGWVLYFSDSSGAMIRTWGVGGIALAMLIVVQINWANYHTTLLRSHGNIGAVSRWFFLQGLIGALLGLGLIRWLGVWGLLWGWFAGTLVAFARTRWEARHIAPLRPLAAEESVQLVQVGFPMFFFMVTSLASRSLDRLIILRHLGTRELGYYSLAVTALTLLMYLPDSATYVFYPRLLQRFRAAGDRPEAIRDSVVGVVRILVAFTAALGGLAFVGARDVIEIVLPAYGAGSTAVRVMCFTAAGMCLTNFSSVVLMTLNRQVWLMPAAALVTAGFFAADLAVIRAGLGISGVAWATLAVNVAGGLAMLLMVLVSLRLGVSRVARELGFSGWSIASAMALAFAVDRLAPWGENTEIGLRLLHLVLGWATFLVTYTLAVAPLMRGLGILQLISELNLPFVSRLRRGAPGGTDAT